MNGLLDPTLLQYLVHCGLDVFGGGGEARMSSQKLVQMEADLAPSCAVLKSQEPEEEHELRGVVAVLLVLGAVGPGHVASGVVRAGLEAVQDLEGVQIN